MTKERFETTDRVEAKRCSFSWLRELMEPRPPLSASTGTRSSLDRSSTSLGKNDRKSRVLCRPLKGEKP